MRAKFRERTEQQKNGELGLIIDEFGRAMWNADRSYISRRSQCCHDDGIRFTPGMKAAWDKYIEFCTNNPE